MQPLDRSKKIYVAGHRGLVGSAIVRGLKAKGYTNSVVMIGIDSNNITVVVEDENFNTDDAVAIYTIMLDEVGASPEDV